MKGSGINYFISDLGLSTGDFRVFYTFEEGGGTTVQSVPDANSIYSGILSAENSFWIRPGSGFFSGNSISVTNASGLYNPTFTHIFGLRKSSSNGGVLFSSLGGGSGYSIGITDSNRVYIESSNPNGDRSTSVLSASYTNLGAKSIVSVGYTANSVSFGYYDFNKQAFSTETFTHSFGTMDSNNWVLGPSFTGYLDYYLYFSSYYGAETLSQIASGFYNTPTGSFYPVTSICVPEITGYTPIPFITTGIVGYQTVFSGGSGYDAFGDLLPAFTTTIPITGIINSGVYQSGVTGLSCTYYTGDLTTLYETNIGYASGFGMQKVLMTQHVQDGDVVKFSSSHLFNPIFNQIPSPIVSGYNLGSQLSSGQINLFWNGLFVENTGFSIADQFLFVSGASAGNSVMFDLFSGIKTNQTGATFAGYTGQEIYLNGLNLVSGLDFTVSGATLFLNAANSGMSGLLAISPIGLPYTTGKYQIYAGITFARGTSNVYLNGVRQQINSDYIEGSAFDALYGNDFNNNDNTVIYDNNDRYWE